MGGGITKPGSSSGWKPNHVKVPDDVPALLREILKKLLRLNEEWASLTTL